MYLKKVNIIVLIVLTVSFLLIATAGAIAPGIPVINENPSKGNFWVNYTWSPGGDTDSFNVSVNGNWTNGNGTKNLFKNITSSPHGIVSISVAGYNATMTPSLSSPDIDSTQITNNPITLKDVLNSYFLSEGQTLYIDANYSDADFNDNGTFATNAITNPKVQFNTSTGVLIWTPIADDGAKDGKVYTWSINVTDGWGSYPSPKTFTVTVYVNSPEPPKNFAYSEGASWRNYTWSAGANTDSFNVSVNGIWTNGTALFKNTTFSRHEWVNISVAGYNATSQLISSFVKDTFFQNNQIILTNVSDSYFLNEGDTLHIKPGYTDADNDIGTFATNAITNPNVAFNPSSGELSWKTKEGDGGIYNWYINVTDGYGIPSSQQFKVIIPVRLSIKFKEPSIINDSEEWIAASVGHIGKFIGAEANFKNTGEDSLVLTVTAIYNNTRTNLPVITIAKNQTFSFRDAFEINSLGVKNGLFNYTFEMEVKGFNGNYFTFSYRNTTNISLPVIPIFKMKRANADGVLVTEGSTTPPIIYTLEANSSINLTDISIYDPFYPQQYFNISKLEVNNSKNICWNNRSIVSCKQNYTYQVTTNDLSSKKCEEGYACIINLATFKGKNESGGWINDTDYVEITVNRFPVSGSDSSSSRSGTSGGGGGGGGLASSEDFNNIEKREVREMDVFFKLSAAYVFTSADPVKIVSFESGVSQNQVPVAVEVLKNRSKHVEEDVPGHLYKYFNIFVGTSGFSKKVSNGVVFFRINNSWLKNNDLGAEDIKLYKWNGSWVEKNTEIVESRDNSTYYASLTGNFSSFAIAGIKKPEVVKVSIDELDENSTRTLVNSSGKDVKQPENFNSIIWIIAIIGIISIIYYFKKIKLK